jgi:nicotinamide-nucleotide amidase
MLPDSTLQQAEALLAACRDKGIRLAIAEGCTGGLIAAALTAIPGCSDVLDRAFITYANAAKTDLLGVPTSLITEHGTISQPVAAALAESTLLQARATIALAVIGLAGPTGASPDKPIGLVCFGLARAATPVTTDRQLFPGNRTEIRAAAVAHALNLVRAAL